MDVRDTARAFIAGAFDALRKEFVLPTPVFHPYVQVGRDYYGSTIHSVPEYRLLEQQLQELYPQRFSEEPKRLHREFPSTYIFNFLEAGIARCGRLGYRDEQNHFDAQSDAVTETIDELFDILDAPTYEVVCCRVVSHLATESGDELTLGGITVVPESERFGDINQRIGREIAGGWSAFNRDDPRPYDPPLALLIARERTDAPDPYEVADRLSGTLERFLRLARLFSAGTVYSMYEVRGMATLVSRMNPYMTEFRGARTLVRRTVWLNDQHGPAFEAIGELVDQADVKREGMAATSFDVALGKFNGSHHQVNPYEALVDVATALEAILAGGGKRRSGSRCGSATARPRCSRSTAIQREPSSVMSGFSTGCARSSCTAAKSRRATCAATSERSRRCPTVRPRTGTASRSATPSTGCATLSGARSSRASVSPPRRIRSGRSPEAAPLTRSSQTTRRGATGARAGTTGLLRWGSKQRPAAAGCGRLPDAAGGRDAGLG